LARAAMSLPRPVHTEAERFFSSAELETQLKPDEILAAVSTLLNLSTR